MRSTFGGGPNQVEHLSLPSVAGATFSKVASSSTMGVHNFLGQENHFDNMKSHGKDSKPQTGYI